MEKFKKRLDSVFEKLKMVLENIASDEALIKSVVPKTEEALADISVETNDAGIKTFSTNLDLASDGNEQTDGNLDSSQKWELNTIFSDEENICEDSISNESTSYKELDKSAFSPHQTDGSNSSVTSWSSFDFIESKSSAVHEEFDFDDLKEQSNLSLNEFDTAYNDMVAQDSVSEKRYTAVSKHFDNSENTVQEQDGCL